VAKVFPEITDHLRDWIGRQPLFFVGTAPLSGDGHVNVSPKGPIGSLAVLGPHEVAYLDVSGSGAETIAHVRENGRIVIMLCAFQGPPRIVRLHGRAEVVRFYDDGFDELLARCGFEDPSIPEARRAVVRVDVSRVADACGYGVPVMEVTGEREHLSLAQAKRLRTMGPEAYEARLRVKNARSVDGLPAVD
jgi:hypothetical protein